MKDEGEPAPSDSADREPQTVTPPSALLLIDGEEKPLKPGVNTFGRKPENDVQIADPYVSGQHGQIEVEADGIYLTDLGSTNGTFLNGAKMEPSMRTLMTEEDEVRIGGLALSIKRADCEAY